MLLARIATREKKGILSCARRYASAESTLRAQPWAHKDKPAVFEQTQIRTTAARFNMDMAAKADVGAFPACFAYAANMKQAGLAPNIATYNTLLRALAAGAYGPASLATLEDMLAVGVTPNAKSLNHILDAHRAESSSLIPYILTKLESMGVAPTTATYTLLITRFVAEENLEVALQYLHAMKARNLLPDVAAAQAVIVLAANQGFPRLAVDLAISFENQTVRKVENSVWLACLHSSAAELYAEGVSKSWYTLVTDLAISPDEGLCTLVLNTAARHGLPDLASDALRVLKVLEMPWMEHHMACLLEAFCRAERYQQAFSTLAIMRETEIIPTIRTALPIVKAVEQRPELLDDLWDTLSRIHQEGKAVDPSACSALVQAALSTQPLSRALGDYNALKSLGVTPNAEIFHTFVDGCISAGNVAYGELAFQQLKDAGVALDHDIFGKMITLHLTQDTYDDAFLYLEEMQGAGHVPARDLYTALAVKCATQGDHRYLVALDEMKEVGHKVPLEFKRHCSALNDAAHARLQLEALKDPEFGKLGVDGSAQRFIETGGLSGLGIPHQK